MHQSIVNIRLKTASQSLKSLEYKRIQAELNLAQAELEGDARKMSLCEERLFEIDRYLAMAADLIEVFSQQLKDY